MKLKKKKITKASIHQASISQTPKQYSIRLLSKMTSESFLFKNTKFLEKIKPVIIGHIHIFFAIFFFQNILANGSESVIQEVIH